MQRREKFRVLYYDPMAVRLYDAGYLTDLLKEMGFSAAVRSEHKSPKSKWSLSFWMIRNAVGKVYVEAVNNRADPHHCSCVPRMPTSVASAVQKLLCIHRDS